MSDEPTAGDEPTSQGLPIPPIKDVVHGIGDKLREKYEQLRDAYARRRRARLITLGLFLVGTYVLFFTDES